MTNNMETDTISMNDSFCFNGHRAAATQKPMEDTKCKEPSCPYYFDKASRMFALGIDADPEELTSVTVRGVDYLGPKAINAKIVAALKELKGEAHSIDDDEPDVVSVADIDKLIEEYQ